MAVGQGSLAGIARVAFEASTHEFNADISRAEQVFHNATKDMSSDTIRLELAQDKLRRALAKGPGAFREQARAELELRRVQEGLRVSTDRLDRSQDRAHASMGRFGRGALAGTGFFQGFARSIAFASSAFLGGAGFIYALRSTVNAAIDAERIQIKLRVAVRNAGLSWEANASSVDKAIRAHSRLTGIDDEELSEALANMVRTTKDVNEALRLNAIAADISRVKGQSLAEAQSLIARVYNGQYRGLKQLGVAFEPVTTAQDRLRDSGVKFTRSQLQAAEAQDKVASRQKAIAALQSTFAGQAEAYGRSAAGSQDRFRVALENTQEVIGKGVLPALTDLLNKGAAYLDNLSDSGDLQRKVNSATEAGAEIYRGLAGALQVVRGAAAPVVDALGGIENTVKAAGLAWVAFKVKALLGFSATAAASRATASRMVGDAAVAGRAWDVATRPRALIVTGGGIGGTLGRGGLAALLGSNLAIAAAVAGGLGVAGAVGTKPNPKDIPTNLKFVRNGRLYGTTPRGPVDLGPAPAGHPDGRFDPNFSRPTAGAAADRPGEGRLGGPGGRPSAAPSGGSRSGRGAFTLAAFTNQFAALEEAGVDAEFTPGIGDDLRNLRARNALIQRALREVELSRDQRLDLKRRRLAVLADIGRIEQEEDQAAAEMGEKRRAANEKARGRDRKLRERAETEFIKERQRAFSGRLPPGQFAMLPAGEQAARQRAAERRRRGAGEAADEDKPLTKAELQRALFEYTTSLHGVIGQFGSNVAGDNMGQVATHAHIQSSLLQRQNDTLERMLAGSGFSGTAFARGSLAAAGLGAGF